MKSLTRLAWAANCAVALALPQLASAACNDLSRSDLENAITVVNALSGDQSTGGYNLEMWVTMVDETGKVCHVATSGEEGALAGNSEWLGSRVISAQKANTANAFSLNGYAISTANLYTAVQPGGSLYGLQHSNPVDASAAYSGSPNAYGKANDPLKNKRIGGINVFGGGLALYKEGKKIGAIGVSGDTSCRDHAYAWRLRKQLNLNPDSQMNANGDGTIGDAAGITLNNVDVDGAAHTPLTGAADGDEMIIDKNGTDVDADWNAWEHPACPNTKDSVANGVLTN